MAEKKSRHKLFEYLPAIVIIYFVVMLLSTFGLWQKSESVTATYKSVKSNLLPAMIFLMLLLADMREIFKLGKKMLLTFLLASVSMFSNIDNEAFVWESGSYRPSHHKYYLPDEDGFWEARDSLD